MEERKGPGQEGLLETGAAAENGSSVPEPEVEMVGIEEDLLRIAAADKKTISIKWDSPHERMARDLETDLHFDKGLSTRTVNRSTLSALGLELLYEKFYGRKPPGI